MRLGEEVEGKGIVPHNQTDFRKRIGTLDNIYVLNHIVNREVSKKRGG